MYSIAFAMRVVTTMFVKRRSIEDASPATKLYVPRAPEMIASLLPSDKGEQGFDFKNLESLQLRADLILRSWNLTHTIMYVYICIHPN